MNARYGAPCGLLRVCLAFVLTSMVAAVHAEGPPQRVIVKYRAAQTARDASAIASRAMTDTGARFGTTMRPVRQTTSGAQVVAVERELSRTELSQLVAELRASPDVEYAEEDQLLHASFTPDDTYYSLQWHYYEATAGINLPSAWDVSTGSAVTVAIIDTGYRPHVDLAANVVGGYDFISDTFVSRDGDLRDSDAQDPGDWTLANDCAAGWAPTDSSWHGTHVAGTVAARTHNSSGVAGVAFDARVLPVRVLGRCGGYISDIADGLVWASGGSVSGVPANPNPAKVANLSLGGTGSCSTTMRNAINSARSRGTVVVVAAGNESRNTRNVTPANCPGVVTVAAVNRSGGRAYYSNFGSAVDVAAPGGAMNTGAANGVLSTLNFGTTTPAGDAYAYYQGTSMATPHVAGVAALMLSVNGSLTPTQVETLLRSTTRSFPATCSQCGTGIVDAAAAVAAAGP